MGYPSYDRYDFAHAKGPLVDADLLAPLLLNVNRISIQTYEALQGARAPRQPLLEGIDADLPLLEANNSQLEMLGLLFTVIDGDGLVGVQGTVLSSSTPKAAGVHSALRRTGATPLSRRITPSFAESQGRRWSQFMALLAGPVQE